MSKWEDTVMSPKQIETAIKVGWLPHLEETLTDYELFELRYKSVAQAQAEISFKAGKKQGMTDKIGVLNAEYRAGKKAGIKEVVEFIEKHTHTMNTNMYGISLGRVEWQAQKKEWEVSND